MATRAKQQYYGDGSNIVKNSRTFELSQEILDKIDSAGGEGAISTIKVNGVVQPITNKTVNIGVPVVEDNLNSYSTANALSANQGRLLYDEIQKFQTIGHFLSLWDSTTGKPITDPTTLPYIYNTGDYFIVSKVGTTNYRPDGTEYTGAASQVAESEPVTVDDFYFFNGTNWFHLKNEGAGVAIDTALSTTSTNPVENRVVTEAINQKASLENLQELQEALDEKADAGDIPTVNDATLTIQKNGTDQGTFSANQATDTTINLTVNKIDVGLSNVDNTSDADKPISTATQTALDDLSDRIDGLETGDITDIKDDITDLQDNKADKTDLGDATLTVQKNGTAVGTFTANSKTDTTINLELTKSDVGLGNVDNTADVDKPISTATQEALDAKADKSDTYTKDEADAKIDEKLGDTVNDATITITQGGTTKGTFTLNQAGDATIALDAGSEDGMQYPDFAFVNKTGNNITLDISSKVANPSADFTINAPSEIKDGITYVLRVENGATPPAMTLGTNITNPYNVDLTLSASKTDTFAFLAVDGKLEMQPTEADVPENVYTKEEVDTLLEDKADKTDLDNVYTKTEVDTKLDKKVNVGTNELFNEEVVSFNSCVDGEGIVACGDKVEIQSEGGRITSYITTSGGHDQVDIMNGQVKITNSTPLGGDETTVITQDGITFTEGQTTETYNFTGNDRIARLSDINTKIFYLLTDKDLEPVQAAYDWYLAGKNPIIRFDGTYYVLGEGPVSGDPRGLSFKFLCMDVEPVEEFNNATTHINFNNLTFFVNDDIVQSVVIDYYGVDYLDTTRDYATPYTPRYDGSPATKKYVDDAIAGVENNVKVFELEDENDFTTAQEAWDYIRAGMQNIAYIKFKNYNYIYAPQGVTPASNITYDFYHVGSYGNASQGTIGGLAFDIVRFTTVDNVVTDIDKFPKLSLKIQSSLPAEIDNNTLYFITGS